MYELLFPQRLRFFNFFPHLLYNKKFLFGVTEKTLFNLVMSVKKWSIKKCLLKSGETLSSYIQQQKNIQLFEISFYYLLDEKKNIKKSLTRRK